MFNVEDMETGDGVLVFTVIPFLIGLLAYGMDAAVAFIFIGWFIYIALAESP